MTTATVADATTGTVHLIRQVSIADLEDAAAATASLIDSGASFAAREAAAAREMGLAAMYAAGHGEADLDAAARDWEAAYASAHPAPDTWAATEHEPEAGA